MWPECLQAALLTQDACVEAYGMVHVHSEAHGVHHWQALEQDVLDAAAWAAGVPLKLHLVAGILARNADRTSAASGIVSSADAGAAKAAGSAAGQGSTVSVQRMLSKSASLDMCATMLSVL